jgi:DNA-binding MarR family transcriptional regulator
MVVYTDRVGQRPIARLLAVAFREAVDEMHVELRKRGHPDLRPAHGFLLNLIGDGATAGELASGLGITKQGAAKLVEALTSTGYLERQPHPADRRATLICLTPRGREALAAAVAAQRKVEARWTRLLGRTEMQALRAALETLADEHPSALRPTW